MELFEAATARARSVADLAAAEVRLAALSGLTMLLLAIVAAASLVVAWALVIGCVLYVLERAGVDLLVPGLLLAAGHGALAVGLWRSTVKLSRNLTLPELRASFSSARPEPRRGEDGDGGNAVVPSRS